jgi:hypothetical protein
VLLGVPAILALAVAGCGVPVDGAPTVLPKKSVPFGLLAQSAPPSASRAPAPSTVSTQIFLISSSGQLVAVTRDLPFPAPLNAILEALVVGPSNAEAASGLQSAVPSQTQVLGATVSGSVATVDLSGTFAQLVGQPQIEAVAQIVFTATALSGLSEVTFELDGQQVAVPTASGVDVPIATRSEFASMAPT